MRNSVTVARQTLTLFVGVRIPIPQPPQPRVSRGCFYRGVAQFGSAHRSGRWGRKFESCHLDHPKHSQKSLFMRLLGVLLLFGKQKCVIGVLFYFHADFSILSFSNLEIVSQPCAVASLTDISIPHQTGAYMPCISPLLTKILFIIGYRKIYGAFSSGRITENKMYCRFPVSLTLNSPNAK